MSKCRDTNNLMHDYVEGALKPSMSQELERHLADCPGCVAFMKTYQRTIDLSKELRCEDVPLQLRSKLRSFIKQNLHKPKS